MIDTIIELEAIIKELEESLDWANARFYKSEEWRERLQEKYNALLEENTRLKEGLNLSKCA